jgi:copper transport protein
MVFLHVVSIAWWAGELLPLAVILRQSHAIADPPLMRFSRFIPFVIAPLVVSGVTLATIQLGPPGDAWLTPYTYLFGAKLILLLVLFAVAGWNRWYLTARVMSGDDAATRHLGRAIALEIALIMVIVGVAAGWRFTPPPRTLAVQIQNEAMATLSFPKGELAGSVSVTPARPGENTVTVVLNTPNGAATGLKSVRVALSNEALGIPKLVLDGALNQSGIWKSEAALVPAAGDWTITVEVRISDFVQVRGSAVLVIGPPPGPE